MSIGPYARSSSARSSARRISTSNPTSRPAKRPPTRARLPVVRRGSSSSSSSNPTGDQREQASGSVRTVSTRSGVTCTVVAVLQVAIALLGTFTVSSRVPRRLQTMFRANAARGSKRVALRGAREQRAVVVELDHLDRALGRGVEAQAAEHAFVEVLLDDAQGAVVLLGVDVHGADLGELRRQLGVGGHGVVDLDGDEQPVGPHAAVVLSASLALTRSGI